MPRSCRILNFAPIVKIGVLSYSIYIWQTLFLHEQNFKVFGSYTWISTFPGNWLGFSLLACFSYYVIEQPSLNLRGRLIQSFHLYAAKRQTRQPQLP